MVKEWHIGINTTNKRAIESVDKLVEFLVKAGFSEAEQGKLYIDEEDKEQGERLARVLDQFPDFKDLA